MWFDCIKTVLKKLKVAYNNSLRRFMGLQFIYNGSKSFSLCFKRKDLKISSPTFFLDQSKIPLVEQCRYLGTTISIKNSDLKRQMRKMHANANSLLRKFSKCSVNVKCYLFKTYCSILYCAPM